MKKLILFPLILCFITVHADDGSFYSNGSTLLPLKETTISMKREILNLTRDGTFMQVDIYFEFFNPGPQKELTVGFVTPPADGDVREDESQHPQIEDFMVMVNDSLLPYKIIRMEKSGFKLNEKIAGGNDFVYYFKVMFHSGITIIRHSYKYRGGSSVEAKDEFLYRLTTGTGWAGGVIEDFELNINMENDTYFAVPAFFSDTPAQWIIAGIGKVSGNMKPPYDFEEPSDIKMVYMKKGYLTTRVKNFKPEKDLSLTIYQLQEEINLWTNKKAGNDFTSLDDIIYDKDSAAFKISHLSDEQLRLYKNLEYARGGYDFKDPWMRNKFSKYIWYIPDPAIKPENIINHYFDKGTLQLILDEEKKRKNNSAK
jgi:hypothetical protein